ncbi:hypothetical protein [Amycolatopsis sp. NPDC051903]|uniref:hypothetical protein n=1 Tax=Amycolatopsis sp. NPDC051903 TaxID=3363936 RepID=UPI0037B900D5
MVFAAGAAVLALSAVYLWRRDGRADHRWVLSTADFLVMAAMCAAPAARLGPLASLCAAFLTVEGLAWVFEAWGGIRRGSAGPITAGATLVATRPDVGARASLAAMAAGMAFMLVAVR